MTADLQNNPKKGQIVFYQTEDGDTRIQCRFEQETLWLTQAQIAELFQTTLQNVTLHLKAIFAEGELTEAATCKEYLQVQKEGNREISRSLRHWRIGKRIQTEILGNQSADYRKDIVQSLSAQLSWSHYAILKQIGVAR